MSRPRVVTKKKPAAARAKRAAKRKKGAASPSDRAAPPERRPRAAEVPQTDLNNMTTIQLLKEISRSTSHIDRMLEDLRRELADRTAHRNQRRT